MLEKLQNIVYDINYPAQIPWGGFVVAGVSPTNPQFSIWNQVSPSIQAPITSQDNPQKKKSWIDKLLEKLWLAPTPKNTSEKKELPSNLWDDENSPAKQHPSLAEQVRAMLQLPDSEYSDKKLTSELRQYIKEVDTHYTSLLSDYKSHIAPSYWEFSMQQFNVSGILGKTYYTQDYPSYIDMLWTRDIMGLHCKWDMSFYIYPEDDSAIQSMLKQKTTQLKAELSDAMQKGITIDKEVEQQYRDVEMIREKLTTKEERYFELWNYTTIYDTSEEKLRETGKKFEQKIAGYGIRVKNAIHRMDEGFWAN